MTIWPKVLVTSAIHGSRASVHRRSVRGVARQGCNSGVKQAHPRRRPLFSLADSWGSTLRTVECLSRARLALIWGSAGAAVLGWGLALLAWKVLGHSAGVDPGFILALCVGITATIVCAQSIVMPDQARIHALGVQAGLKLREESQPPDRHLRAVNHK